MQQTSLQSYIQLRDEGVLGKRQHDVYVCISANPNGITDRKIAEALRLPINCVTARRNELAKQGFIAQDGCEHDEITNRMVMKWRSL